MTDQRRDTSPTLAALATLAAKNVPEFKWPEKRCQSCEGVGTTWGQLCGVCGGASRLSDDAPAALAVAVLVAITPGETPESVTRSLLIALLLAHEVEIPNDE